MADVELESGTKSSSREVVTSNSVERERFRKRALAIQREIRAYATSMKVMQRTFINKRSPCINFEDEETKQFLYINRLENAKFRKTTNRKSKIFTSALPSASATLLPAGGMKTGPRTSLDPKGCSRNFSSKLDSKTVPELPKNIISKQNIQLSPHHRKQFRKGLLKNKSDHKSFCEPVVVNPPSITMNRGELNVNKTRLDSRALLRAHIEQEHPLIGQHGRSSSNTRHDDLLGLQMELNDSELFFYNNELEKPQIVVEEEENMKETQRKIKDFLDRTCAESVCSDTETPNFWNSDEKKRKVSRVYSLNTPYRSKACSTRISVLGIHQEPTSTDKNKLGMQLPPMILPPIHNSYIYKPKARVWSMAKSTAGGSNGQSIVGNTLTDEDWEDLKKCRYLRIVEEVSKENDATDDVFESKTTGEPDSSTV